MKRFTVLMILFALLLPCSQAGNAVNDYTEARNQQAKLKIAWPIADDYTFLRRVWLDIAGTLPPEEVLSGLLATEQPWDREAIIDMALESEDYIYRWTYFLEDLFASRTIDDSFENMEIRNEFNRELNRMLSENMSWDEITEEMITWQGYMDANPGLYNFWGMALGEPLTWLDGLDDQVSYITDKFLGIRTECISCHNGAFHLEDVNIALSKRKREEFWGMAAFLSSAAFRCRRGDCVDDEGPFPFSRLGFFDFDVGTQSNNKGQALVYGSGEFNGGRYHASSQVGEGMRPARDGGYVDPVYLWTGETPDRRKSRRSELARMIVADRQFSRNMVNRVWRHFFGAGFVEPVHNWDLARIDRETAKANNSTPQPVDVNLMELVTDAFIDSGFDIKALIKLIVSSELYQLDLDRIPDMAKDYRGPYFGGKKRIRRLESEGILEAVMQAADMRVPFLVFGLVVDDSNNDELITKPWRLPDSKEPLFPNEIAQLLDDLGRGDRFKETAAKAELDRTACLALMNSEVLLEEVLPYSGYFYNLIDGYNAGQYTEEQMVEGIYLRFLIRPPTEEERAEKIAHLQTKGLNQGLLDVMWSLINSPDFLFR